MSNKTSPEIRMMTLADLAAVMRIEQAAHLAPWTEGIFLDCLRVGYLCRVLADATKIYGYSVLSHGAGEAHILNITVDPQHQRQGYGRRLMQQILDDAAKLDVDTLLLEVRASNHSAISLYHAFGFNEVGVRENYYPAKQGREDALVFAKALLLNMD